MRTTRVPADLSLFLVCLVLVPFLTAAIWRWGNDIGADTRVPAACAN